MFHSEEYIAKENDRWMIQKYLHLQFGGATAIEEKFAPRHDAAFVFHFGDRPILRDGSNYVLEPFFIASIQRRALQMCIQGNLDSFIVICNPTVLSRLYNLDMAPVSKHSISLPNNQLYPIWEQLKNCSTFTQRVALFQSYINHSFPAPYIPDAIDKLYEEIVNHAINTPLKYLIETCGGSPRTIERNFIHRLGVSPKTLMRIVRFNYLWDKIRTEHVLDYQDLVFDGHFFDQSHFIKDFKDIIGETPSYFFKRNLQHLQIISGKGSGNS